MRLFVVADYRARQVYHPKGAVLEVPADVAAFLMADAPGCFSTKDPSANPAVSVETVKEIAGAPKDKMMRKQRTK